MNSICRSEIIQKVADKTSLSSVNVHEIIRQYEEEIISSLHSGQNVKLSGFLSFIHYDRSSRNGTDPNTHQVIVLPKKRAIRIKLSKKVKELYDKNSRY